MRAPREPDVLRSYTVNIYTCALCPGREFKGNGAWNSHSAAHERHFEKFGTYRRKS